MTKATTHVLIITDRSGSMYSVADDVRGGYNAYLQSLQDDTEVRYRVTSVLFSNRGVHDEDPQTLCVAAEPRDAPRFDERSYAVGGSTALLDAIGCTITEFEARLAKNGAGLAVDDRVLLVVQTDGQENASTEYDAETIRKMIADREAGGQWAAIFMGAGPDTWRQAGAMGFQTSVSYAKTEEGVSSSYAGLTKMSGTYSRGATRSQAAAKSGLTVEEDS